MERTTAELFAAFSAQLCAVDRLTMGPAQCLSYVDATLEACRILPFADQVPNEIFVPWVLDHRAGYESPDQSRPFLLAQLAPLVRGKTMEQAALTVNLWCCGQATYAPTDDRTLGPLGIIRRGLGRCGEESVLLVSALRAVGIPARQVYCPRWSHCDDNHAWVETWIDGHWHHMGACEPEPVLDKGWYLAAASRAMVVHTRAWSGSPILVTDRYAKTAALTVTVLDHGAPAQNVPVEFSVNNFSELYPIYRGMTDESGNIRVELGLGGLCVQAGSLPPVPVDLRKTRTLALDLGVDLPENLAFDLVPPEEQMPPDFPPVSAKFEGLLAQCRTYRLEKPTVPPDALPRELREKDRYDLDPAVLTDCRQTVPARAYDDEILEKYLWNPRIGNEMLRPERKKCLELLPEGLSHPADLRRWMEEDWTILPDDGVRGLEPGLLGCVRRKTVPAASLELVFTGLCRCLGWAARLEPLTGRGQWLEQGRWQPVEQTAALTLVGESAFTLGRWVHGRYETLSLPGYGRYDLPVGKYRLISTTRQIDGTASTHIRCFRLDRDREIRVEAPADESARKLRQVDLGLASGARLLVVAAPGEEPTEHLLRELLDLENLPGPVELLADGQNKTLDRCRALEQVTVRHRDPILERRLREAMGVGDQRLPLVILTDSLGRGVFAQANYQVGLVEQLRKIRQIMEQAATGPKL